MSYRPFGALYSPTLACEWDGVMLYTIPECLDIGQTTHEPVPCYIIETSEYAAVVLEKDMKWKPVGTFTLPIEGSRKEGTHLPDAIVEEFRDWCNEFAESHPTTQCIVMTSVSYERNKYQACRNYAYSYNQLKAERDQWYKEHQR
jgi:hypothetical protein